MANKSFKAEVILEAKDRASKELKNTSSAIDNVKKNWLAYGAVVAGVMAGIGFAIKKASDLEETQSKFNVVFRGQVKQVEEWSEALQKSYAMSEIESKKYLSSVQDLLVPMGMQRESAGKLSNEIVKLAADLGSFNNMPTAQVMGDIQSALTGMVIPMKKYGIVLSAELIKQEALNLGLYKGKGELTASAKAQATYSLMVKNSSDAMGDMVRTQKSFANQMKFAKAGLDDLITNIGKGLLPMATKLVNSFNNDVIPAIKREVEVFEKLGRGIKIVIGNIDDFIEKWDGLKESFDLSREASELFLYVMTGRFPEAIDLIKEKFSEMTTEYEGTMGRMIGITNTFILGATKGYKDLRDTRTEAEKTVAKELEKYSKDSVNIIANSLTQGKNLFKAFGDYVIYEVIKQVAVELVAALHIAQILKATIGGIGGIFSKILPFADGTDYAKGGLSVVGERGPELVNLPVGSQVMSNEKSRQIINNGGSSRNVYVTVTGNNILDEDGAEGLADRIGNVLMRKVNNEALV